MADDKPEPESRTVIVQTDSGSIRGIPTSLIVDLVTKHTINVIALGTLAFGGYIFATKMEVWIKMIQDGHERNAAKFIEALKDRDTAHLASELEREKTRSASETKLAASLTDLARQVEANTRQVAGRIFTNTTKRPDAKPSEKKDGTE